MATMQTHRRVGWLVAAAAAVLLAAPATANADKKTRPKYYYKVFKVTLKDGLPPALQAQVAEQLDERIAANPQLADSLEGAPDPEAEPKKFERWLARKKMRAFKVNIEVLSYKHELEPMPAPRKGKRLTVAIDLRAFGETIPGRVMAFTGEGSATIMIEVGRKLRPRDSKVGNHDAIEMALDKALAESIHKLETAEAEAKKAAKKKRRRKK